MYSLTYYLYQHQIGHETWGPVECHLYLYSIMFLYIFLLTHICNYFPVYIVKFFFPYGTRDVEMQHN